MNGVVVRILQSHCHKNTHVFVTTLTGLAKKTPTRSELVPSCLRFLSVGAAEMDLCGVLSRSLSTREGERQPQSLHSLCIRTAAIYATTALYEFHDKQKALGNEGDMQQQQQQQQQQQLVHESAWEQVFPMLDQHFLRLVPGHRYEQFLDSVLQALEVAGHFDQTGRQLMQYIVLFFPRHIRCFRVARRYDDRVLMPTVCCLHKCTNMEELYLEKADSHGITTYLLAHVLKFVNRLKVLSLPAQSDDDVLSTVGINCPKLESIVLTDTNVTNSGLAWLLCCRKLHTVILPGMSCSLTSSYTETILHLHFVTYFFFRHFSHWDNTQGCRPSSQRSAKSEASRV